MFSLDQILPSLESFGIWSYWLIGLAAFLEGLFVTGIVFPGSLIVDAGGILAQRGVVDFFDLLWFVAIGSALGGEASFWIGRLAMQRDPGRFDPEKSAVFRRASALFARRGPMALVLGNFAGPVSGFVPLAAALSGMSYRRFAPWNLLGSATYAIGHLLLGYFLGGALSHLGASASRDLVLIAAISATLALVWFLLVRLKRGLPFLWSILQSMGRAIAANPEVQFWSARHPKTANLIASRLDHSRFGGLRLTVLTALIAYVLFLYVGSVLDVVLHGPIVEVDVRLASLIHAFWETRGLRIAAHLTALGDWRTVTALVLGAAAMLMAYGRWPLALGMGIAVIGNVTSVALLKSVFNRPRPELAYFTETSGSLPSGHAAISVAFYGYLCFVGWRLRFVRPFQTALLACTIALLIGSSRVYLIEHYLSDVLNGYLVGAFWLLVGITVAEWQSERADNTVEFDPVVKSLAAVVGLILSFAAIWTVMTYEKALNIVQTVEDIRIVSDIPALWTDDLIQPMTETIAGEPQEPINLVIVAPDLETLTASMTNAGWIVAQPPGFSSLGRAAIAAWTNQPDPNAPVTPYFWQGQPNAIAFQMPTADATLRKRHHVRFWPSAMETADGAKLFFGAASFDDGLDWGVTHHINPDIDAERDFLVKGLLEADGTAVQSSFQGVPAQQGTNFNGDPWFTDGAVDLLILSGPRKGAP